MVICLEWKVLVGIERGGAWRRWRWEAIEIR
jgi:hypothetical protein